jgi:AcrR family transcriptional regulator
VLAAATAVFLEQGWGAATVRAVAAAAGVSVATVEALFGTKARLLKAAIDVAIAGDEEPVAVLERPWAAAARQAATVEEFSAMVGEVLAAAQQRSAGLVLAVFDGARRDAGLAELAEQLTAQRAVTAGWILDGLVRLAPLRPGSGWDEAVDTVWVLMDPAVFDRVLTRRGWSAERYARWFADSLLRLLTPDRRPPHPAPAASDPEGGS